jgi:hypothetical protein
MYFCFPPQRQTIPRKHACSSFAAPQRSDQTKCADQYESVNYCYTILQIKAARSAQLCANIATFALILPRAAISLILSVTAYYTVAYNQWLLNSTLYPFVFVCFSICGSVFLARRRIILL